MWPKLLDMTRDECRGILRRLELETYSHVISTFRAQGSLSDSKVRVLDELRTLLHISTDRHRAEARRVTNDEHLCTIAENITGPNTGPEWSREGRRCFPILPRGTAYTALTAVANGVAEIATNGNSRLPHPEDTRRDHLVRKDDYIPAYSITTVTQDPANTHRGFDEKNDLKRPHANDTPSTSSVKKRNNVSHQQQQPELQQQQSQPSIHTNTSIKQLYHTHSKTLVRNRKGQSKKGLNKLKALQKNQQKLKMQELINTPGSSGTQFHNSNINNGSKTNISRNNNNLYSISPSQNNNTIMSTERMDTDNFTGIVNNNDIITTTQSSITDGTVYLPQIATSKKDIATNLTKMNLNTSQPVVYTSPIENLQENIQISLPKTQTIINNNTNNNNNNNNINNINNNSVNVLKSSPEIQTNQLTSWITKTGNNIGTSRPIKMLTQSPNKIINANKQNYMIVNPSSIGIPSLSTTTTTTTLTSPSSSSNVQTTNILQRSLSSGGKMIHTSINTQDSPTKIGNKINLQKSVKAIVSPLDKKTIIELNQQTTLNQVIDTNLKSVAKLTQQISNNKLPIQNSKLQTSSNNNNIQTLKNKVQIINHQILPLTNNSLSPISASSLISSPTSSVRFPPTLQLKSLQNKGNIKIIPSGPGGGGKMLFKTTTTDNTIYNKTPTKLTGITQIKNIPAIGSPPSATTIATPTTNRVSIQNLKLMPMSKTGTKSNMILMKKCNTPLNNHQIAINSSNPSSIKSIKLTKEGNKILIPTKTMQQQNVSYGKNQNVFVLGYSEQEKSIGSLMEFYNQKVNNDKNVITEDTPVDILPSTITTHTTNDISNGGFVIKTSPSSSSTFLEPTLLPLQKTNNQTSNQLLKHLKPTTNVVMKTTTSNKTNKILASSKLQTSKIMSNNKRQQQIKKSSNVPASVNSEYSSVVVVSEPIVVEEIKTVVETPTDWEIELDQANSYKLSNQKMEDAMIMEHFNNVIEEETEDSLICDGEIIQEDGVTIVENYNHIMTAEEIEEMSMEYIEDANEEIEEPSTSSIIYNSNNKIIDTTSSSLNATKNKNNDSKQHLDIFSTAIASADIDFDSYIDTSGSIQQQPQQTTTTKIVNADDVEALMMEMHQDNTDNENIKKKKNDGNQIRNLIVLDNFIDSSKHTRFEASETTTATITTINN